MLFRSGGSPDTKKSLLTSVQQYGSDAVLNQSTGDITSGSVLPAINLEYYNNPRSYLAYSGATLNPASPYYPLSADFNGDGKMDFLIMSKTDEDEESFDYLNNVATTDYKIYLSDGDGTLNLDSPDNTVFSIPRPVVCIPTMLPPCMMYDPYVTVLPGDFRSEERRVGKECR